MKNKMKTRPYRGQLFLWETKYLRQRIFPQIFLFLGMFFKLTKIYIVYLK